jgi:hypothetical protein
MKVYIVETGWFYEPSDIAGVFSTESLAAACAEAIKQKRTCDPYDSVTVTEYELDRREGDGWEVPRETKTP